MNDPRSLRTYLERNILRQSIYVLVILGLFAITISYVVSRYKAGSDIEESAAAVSKAYRSRILEGDIKVAQTQLHEFLHLNADEQVLVLGKDRRPIYREIGSNLTEIKRCAVDGQACLDFGTARVFYPLYFDAEKTSLYGYVYLSRNVRVDWIFVSLTFSIFLVGYLLLYFGFSNLTKRAAQRLSHEITIWAKRLENNPKDNAILSRAPFAELNTLKTAIEGLNKKILDFENQASHKAKLLVLRGIAHDLLGPVAQMQFHFASLKMMPLSEETNEVINDLNDSLERINAIATQVKTLDHNQDDLEIFDLSEAVGAEVETLRNIQVVHQLGLKLEFFGESKLQSKVSKSEISRIIQNLVMNSVQASTNGTGIKVKVASDTGYALIEVSDEGHGIPKHIQEKVFEPDYTSKPGVGTGLGLSIVRHICQQRGGNVTLSSEIGKGTSVQVKLPLYQGGLGVS